METCAPAVLCLHPRSAQPDFSHFSFRDCFYLCLLNSATSIVAGFAIFSVLGFMTYEQGVDISEVAESGKYLVPYATNYGITGSDFWLRDSGATRTCKLLGWCVGAA